MLLRNKSTNLKDIYFILLHFFFNFMNLPSLLFSFLSNFVLRQGKNLCMVTRSNYQTIFKEVYHPLLSSLPCYLHHQTTIYSSLSFQCFINICKYKYMFIFPPSWIKGSILQTLLCPLFLSLKNIHRTT